MVKLTKQVGMKVWECVRVRAPLHICREMKLGKLLSGKHNGHWCKVCLITFFNSLPTGYVAPVSQKQLVNLCIHRQAVDFLCS